LLIFSAPNRGWLASKEIEMDELKKKGARWDTLEKCDLFKSEFQEMGNVMYHKDEEIVQLATWCLSKRLICTLEHM
jgi:hypothetical protein